jgi:putative spermidine/putrescine transport system ATP-binding protein
MSISPAPESVAYSGNSTSNQINGVIELRTFLGPFTRFHVRVNNDATLTADIPSQQSRDFFVAQHITLSFPPDACQVLLLDAKEANLVKLTETETV